MKGDKKQKQAVRNKGMTDVKRRFLCLRNASRAAGRTYELHGVSTALGVMKLVTDPWGDTSTHATFRTNLKGDEKQKQAVRNKGMTDVKNIIITCPVNW